MCVRFFSVLHQPRTPCVLHDGDIFILKLTTFPQPIREAILDSLDLRTPFILPVEVRGQAWSGAARRELPRARLPDMHRDDGPPSNTAQRAQRT